MEYGAASARRESRVELELIDELMLVRGSAREEGESAR
jgi:hypothetical protein